MDKNYLGETVRKTLKKLNISKVAWIDSAGLQHYNKCLRSLRTSLGARTWRKTHNIVFVEVALGHHDPLMRNAWRYIDIAESEERMEVFKRIWN